jgi:Pyridine nucleotide-disulphide oxidoreductase
VASRRRARSTSTGPREATVGSLSWPRSRHCPTIARRSRSATCAARRERRDTLVHREAFYDENGVELLLGTEASGLDPHEEAVTTRDGKRHRYESLLLATGSVPRRLDVEGAGLPGVFNLRSLDDASAIREAAAQARDAVVVGSGFVGMEVAASLTELGLDVTLVSRDVDLFAQLRSPEISEHLVDLYRRRGVEVVRGDEVRAFRGRSRLDTVELQAGEPLAADLAVVGIGVEPSVSFLEGSGIVVDDGVLVDQRFETNVPRRLRRRRYRALLRPALRAAPADRALVERGLPGPAGRQDPRRRRRRLRHRLHVLHRVLRAHVEGLRRRLRARRAHHPRLVRRG